MANKMVSNLSGGINTKTNPLILRDTEFELLVNYDLDELGSIKKRKGYDVFASQPTDDKRVLGLYQYTNTTSSTETTQVMVIDKGNNANTIIYYNNAGTWTASKSNDTYAATITNFNRYRFATFVDYLFRVNGRDSVATSKDVNGGIWGAINAPGTITPAFIAVFKDRVYVANDVGTSGSRMYFSSLPSSGSITWDTTNDYVDVNPDDGDEITALENNGNRLLVFKTRALYRWDYGQTEADRLIGIGTKSQESVKTNFDLGITFFANPKGIFAYTPASLRPRLISRKIQKWINAVPAADWNDVVAEVDEDHYYCYLSDSITVPGVGDNGEDRTFTNVMAVYTISLDAWTIYSLHTKWRFANRLIQSSAEDIYFGSHEGRTYKWLSGNEDDSGGTSENSAVPISAEAITKEHLLTYPEKTMVREFDIISRKAPLTQVYFQTDRKGDFQILNQLKSRFATMSLRNKRSGECRSVRLKFTDVSSTEPKIDAYNIEHTPQRERK